jgi:hypothetical protein
MIVQTKEPPGCEPKNHWEERVVVMEFALQELVIKLGGEIPSAQPLIIKWCQDWTKQRDALRQHHRTDKN